MAKQKVLLSLSNVQRVNAKEKIMEQIRTVNNAIDQRCAAGEEISPNDDSVMKVRKMRNMLSMLGSTEA